MLNADADRTRFLVGAALLGFCIFAASWAVVRKFDRESAERQTVTATVNKLVHGELLQEVRPPQRNDSAKQFTTS